MAEDVQTTDDVDPDPAQVDPFTHEAEQPIWENIGGDH